MTHPADRKLNRQHRPRPSRPSRLDLRRVAVIAECDPRTVEKFLRGQRVRDDLAVAIRDALARLDLERLS